MIDQVTISDFKRIQEADLNLRPINVLVGGNNCGKTCILQGIHFGISLSQARRIANAEQFPAEKLRYCPTDDFLDLRHAYRLTEGSAVRFNYKRNADASHASVTLTRGRNGVVKAATSGNNLLNDISDPRGFFSIYVPGLAGISIREEYRSDLVVENGIARGDANLYLRNVLLRINKNKDKKDTLHKYLSLVFPDISVTTEFNEASDLWIKSTVHKFGAWSKPLDMVGTGLLQSIQIIAYIANYGPKILLLDEPDAHLHPSNQRLLANTLRAIASNTDTKIVLATHSRHILDALSESADSALYWVRDGVATEQTNWSDIAVLMDLGALDSGEKFLAGNYQFLVWTEDTDTKFLNILLEANGIPPEDTMIFSYSASSKIDAANLMAAFVERVRPGVRTIVHRDRDFMSDGEVERLIKKYNLDKSPNMRIFITKGSDIESYFIDPDHIADCIGCSTIEAESLIANIAQKNSVRLIIQFREKREEIKRSLYKNDPEKCPDAADLINNNQLSDEQLCGKSALSLLGPELQLQGKNSGMLLKVSASLSDPAIKDLFVD